MGDRYTITERVDAGGMAEVFRGVAESIQGFKKNVAIKRILPNLTKNEKFVSMFLDEAKLSLYLQHANIVQVFDIGVSDDAYFLVMEFVDGCNLKQLIERVGEGKPMATPLAIYSMLECCKALNYAHNLESPDDEEPLCLVHRDISPPNILISKMGEVKLVDFGLAKASSQLESTDPGVVKGKFSYLSPEAALGKEVDHRADIFAVGILLWEMLTGKRLFRGDTDYQTVELVRQAHVPAISNFNPAIEGELEAIVRKALSRNPEDRFQSAADLGDALAQYLFSRRMKVTARDLAALVRETKKGRRKDPRASNIDGLIQDEMAKITSVFHEAVVAPQKTEGSARLDPLAFLRPESQGQQVSGANELSGQFNEFEGGPKTQVTYPPSKAEPGEITNQLVAAAAAAEAEISEIMPLDTIPDYVPPTSPKKLIVTLLLLVVLGAAIGAGVFVIKDKLTSDDSAETPVE